MSSSSHNDTSRVNTRRGNFADYVEQYKLQPGQSQSHTWFSPNKGPVTLHVPFEDNEDFLKNIFEYISTTSESILENPFRGQNCITEKINTSVNKFRMFADIDFKVDLFEKHELPSDINVLKKQMVDLVKMYDDVISDTFGNEYVKDRVLATRLPYKIHIIYPSVIANKEVAKVVSTHFVQKMKADDRFSKLIESNEQLVDTSVYSTGLRLPGMHKGKMGQGKKKDSNKTEQELQVHENLFGEHSYTHCYKFTDPKTFDNIPFSLTLMKKASIRVEPDTEYTALLQDEDIKKVKQFTKGKGPARYDKGNNSVTSTRSFATIPSLLDDDDEKSVLSGGNSHDILINSLQATVKYLGRQYNHLIDVDKIKYRDAEDDDGRVVASLVFPLIAKECHFIGRAHTSNNQYLVLDKNGSRQKCHDCKDAGDHKPIKPGRFPNSVKEELCRLNVLSKELILKKKSTKKEPSDEQKLTAVDELVNQARIYYPKNELLVDRTQVNISQIGVQIGLQDLWCEVCKKNHDMPRTYLEATETGKMYLKCRENPSLGLFYPNPPLTIDSTTRHFFFSNCNVSFSSTNIINNYGDSTGDVPVDFDQEPIFEDEILNHLIFESLTTTTWPIVKVLHHLGKHKFNCTSTGEWYAYRNHRWNAKCESSMSYFISETIANYYRQVRDYYKENTESQDLRQKRVNHIQRIIDRLTTTSSKGEIMKDARIYFYEQDYYVDPQTQKHFETRLDEQRHLLCFTNGVYDLDADLFREGSPYDFVTMCVNFEYAPISDPKKRSVVEKFFSDMQPDQQERDYLLLFISSMLHGMTKEETFHIFTGAAANGKSLLRDLIMYTLGDYFESIPANLLTRERPSASNPQPEIVRLKGKRAVFGSEPEAGQKINSGFMKWITGNDPMSGRLCHSNEIVSFKPHFKLVLLCNDIPVMDCNDMGTWRRSRIKEFPVMFVDNPRKGNAFEKLIDVSLKDTIQECKSEFMLYLMEYFRRYRKMSTLTATPKILQMVEKHKKRSNTVLQFLDEKTEEAKGSGILITELYPKYTQWMRNELPGEQPLIKSKVIEELTKLRDIEYSKFVRVRGRKSTQQGIKNRRFLPEFSLEDDTVENNQDEDDVYDVE